jgi:hypothetical protein
VVDLLAVDLLGEAGHAFIVGGLQVRDANGVRRLVEPVPSDRGRPVGHEPEFHEGRRPVLLRVPVERERVRVRSELLCCELIPGARVADLGLRDRRERDVLLEEGRDPCPFRVAPAEDQLVVSEGQQFLRVHEPP